MARRYSSGGGGGTVAGIGCSIIAGIIIANLLLGGVCTSYVAESLTGNRPPTVVAIVAGLFLGEFTIPGAAICWLVRSCGTPAPFIHPAAPAVPNGAPVTVPH